MNVRDNHRERLLEGALRCLQAKGYAETTARDIASESAANLGSIGYHFGSKDALLAEALGEGFRRWTAAVSSRLPSLAEGSPLDRLEQAWAQLLDDLPGHRGLLVAFLEALPVASRDPVLRERLAGQYEQSRQSFAALARAAVDASASERDIQGLAALLVAVADGLVVQWALDPERVPDAAALVAGLRLALT